MNFTEALQLVDEVVLLGAEWLVETITCENQPEGQYRVIIRYTAPDDGTTCRWDGLTRAWFEEWRQDLPEQVAFLRRLRAEVGSAS